MPRRQGTAILASSALTKRWAQRESLKNFATVTHGTQTDPESYVTEDRDDGRNDIGTADEILAFSAGINQQLANLPVSVGLNDQPEDETDRCAAHTKLQEIYLSRYGHDLRRATTQEIQVLDSELIFA